MYSDALKIVAERQKADNAVATIDAKNKNGWRTACSALTDLFAFT
jgi:hypothetical protein